MNEIEYKYEYLGIKVNAKISILNEFADCAKFIKAPFSNSVTGMPNDFNYGSFYSCWNSWF